MHLSRLLLPDLTRLIILALLALILFGVLPATSLVNILGLFVAVRIFSLVAEGRQKPVADETWKQLADEVARRWKQSSPEERMAQAAATGFDPAASPAQVAELEVEKRRRTCVAPRGRRELTAEFLGVFAFAVFTPLAIALFANDFFSLRRPQGWIGALVVAVSLALYLMPHLFRGYFPSVRRRTLWWVLPFLPALFAVLEAIRTDHPYLNPLRPDRRQLAAERVLALDHVVIAGDHADWVLRYARDLERQGDIARAVYYYREALRLNADLTEARLRLAELEPGDTVFAQNPGLGPYAPYWDPDTTFLTAPMAPIDGTLERIVECSVVLVRIGHVPEAVLNSTAHAIGQELNLPVLVYEKTIPLPPHTRVRGLLTGRQWDQAALIQALQAEVQRWPAAPIKYVVLTPADIYGSGTNYLFSTTYAWGALVSFARYGDALVPDEKLMHRTAKQTLCALLKSFEVPVSPNRACVTSYTRSLEEFDTKGNRPDAATLKLFHLKHSEVNDHWQRHLQARR